MQERRRGWWRWWAAAMILVGSSVVPGVAGVTPTGATAGAAPCNISQFIRPDGTIDTTGYLACYSPPIDPGNGKPSPDCPKADVQVLATADPNVVSPGATTHFTASGFEPGEEVPLTLCSTPVALGSFTADANGNVDAKVTVPPGTELGAHTLAATGHRAGLDLTEVAYAPLTVVAAVCPVSSGCGPALPVTGVDAGRSAGLGAALVVLGIAAVVGSLRARRRAGPLPR